MRNVKVEQATFFAGIGVGAMFFSDSMFFVFAGAAIAVAGLVYVRKAQV